MATKIRGITIDLGVDTSKLTKGLKDANSSLKSTQTELKDVNKLLKLDPSNTTLLKQKTELLNTAIGDTKKKLEEQQKLMEEMKSAGNTTENQKQQQALERDIEATKNQLKELEKEQKNMPSTFGASLSEAGGHLEAFGGKVESFGNKLTVLSGAVLAVGGASIKAFNDVDKGYDTVIAKTGATGEELEQMQGIVDSIAGKIPADFGDIGDAVGEVATRFGLTGDELEETSTAFLKFAQLNGTDVVSSIDTVQNALSAFAMDSADAGKLLDVLNKTAQNTGADVGSMASALVQNATALQEMGMDAYQATTFLGNLETAGADAESVIGGMKRALKSATDQGIPFKQALAGLEDTIKNGKDGMDGLSASYDLFGKSGAGVFQAVKNGQISFTNLADSANVLDEAVGSVKDTFDATLDPTDEAQIALNKLKTAGAKLGGTLLKTLQPAIAKISEWVGKMAEKWDSLDDTQKNNILRIGAIVLAIGPLVTAIGKVISIAGTLMAHPIVAAIAGTAAVIAGITLAIKNSYGELESYSHKESELFAQANAHQEQFEAGQSAREEVNASVTENANLVTHLKDEYNGLLNAEGQVDAKDQARADFLLTEMANALGMEKGQILELRDANGQLGASIDEVIAKKKTEALLSGYQDSYAEALTGVNTAQKETEELTKKQAIAQEDYTNALNEFQLASTRLATQPYNPEFIAQFARAKEELETSKNSLADINTQLQDSKNRITEYSAIITNYEGLQEASISGNADQIDYWTQRMTTSFQTAESGTTSALETQTRNLIDQYLAEEKAVEEGTSTMDETSRKNLKKMAEDSAKELAKSKGMGEDWAQGLIDGMESKKNLLRAEAYDMGVVVDDAFRSALNINSPSKKAIWNAQMYGEGLIKGLKSAIGPVGAMATNLANATNVPLASPTTTVNNSPTIVVNASAGQSASAIADAVINRLNNTYRQTTKTFA